MIAVVTRHPVHARFGGIAALLAVALGVVSAGCRKLPEDPLKLERNMLTVTNQSGHDWSGVEVWLNTYYRITTSSIPAGGRFQAPLDTFVAGYGQRFDFRRAQIKDLRLTAKGPDGKPFELKKRFEGPGGLAGALGSPR
jgi:hypothetical protein